MNKEEARKKYKDLRSKIKSDELETKSKAIARKFIESGLWKGCSSIHVFLTIPKENEVNTNYIIHYFQANHPTIKLCTSIINEETNELVHTVIDPSTGYSLNKWSIPEPLIIDKVTEDKIDLVIVPLLIVDTKGNRVGYGKGFYDKFLSKCKKETKKVGVSFFEPEKELLETDAWDIPLTDVISPEKVYVI